MTSSSRLPLVIVAALMSACGDSTGTIGVIARNTADVRVLNASRTNIDLLKDQGVDPGSTDIAFGAGSQCKTVDIISHGLSVRPAGVRTTTTSLPSFTSGERYLVVVTGPANALEVVSFRNSFTPLAGSGAVRLINVVGGSVALDIHVTNPGAALGAPSASNIISGAASTYFNVSTTPQQIRLTTAGTGIVGLDLGDVAIPAGSRVAVVAAPPATGATAARAFTFLQAVAGDC